MKRPAIIFAFILMLPALYLGWNDFTKYRAVGQPFAFSTIGEVWMEHDRPGFEEYKREYVNRVREWETDVRPYLEMKAFPIAATPAILYLIWLLVAFLLGIGPFKDMDMTATSTFADGGLGRNVERGNKMKYSRK